MKKLDLANRQGDFFLCLSLSEDVGLSLFDDFMKEWQHLNKNEVYCLQSKVEFEEEKVIKIEVTYQFVNFIFVSLNKEGYKKFINISDHIEIGSIISRIRKVVVFDSFPFMQSDTNDFITALHENLIAEVIPLSVGVVDGNRRFSSTDIGGSNQAIEEAIVKYRALLGDKEIFKINTKLSIENLKQIISRQTSSRILRHEKHLKIVNSLSHSNVVMKEMFQSDLEQIFEEINLGIKSHRYDIDELSKKIYSSVLENIDICGLINFQRKKSYKALLKLINQESVLLARNLNNHLQNKKSNTQKSFKNSDSKNITDKVYNHINNEINYWTNEKQ
jgi:hypothetical protein